MHSMLFSITVCDTHEKTDPEPAETLILVNISKNGIHHLKKRVLSLLYLKIDDMANESHFQVTLELLFHHAFVILRY